VDEGFLRGRRPAVADDIVTRLRANADWIAQAFAVLQGTAELGREAADEIERLRAAGDALDATLGAWARDDEQFVIAAWQEARRG
jgi:hypothetical protein